MTKENYCNAYKNKTPINKGTTLFEVLLYVALFSIISIGAMSVSLSISKTVSQIETTTKRNEIRLMFYEILRNEVDIFDSAPYESSSTSNNIRESFGRVLRVYPQFTLQHTQLNQSTNMFGDTTVTLQYSLRHALTNKIFTETLSVSLI